MWSTFIQDLGKWIWEVAKEAWTWIKNNWDKVMRDVIAKRIMDYIVDQTVTVDSGRRQTEVCHQLERIFERRGRYCL